MVTTQLQTHLTTASPATVSRRPSRLRVLIVGCGTMGASHARGYAALHDQCELVGVVSRGLSAAALAAELKLPAAIVYNSFEAALATSAADIVCISTYPDTHEEYAIAALRSGAHVFLVRRADKPINM
eukprot:SAG11_NODE_2878_length_2878_cov_2.849226_4_plen_128_part_00